MAPQPIPKRAWLRQLSGPFTPWTPGRRFSSGTSTSSRKISEVIEARSENLPLMSRDSKPGRSVSTRKPRTSSPARAQTIATSEMDPLVIQRFVPLSRHAGHVAARVGFGQSEATDRASGGEPGEPLLFLLFGAVGMDREHHQRALHRYE